MNNQVVDYVTDWAIHEEESCSDHKIIKYGIGKGRDLGQTTRLNKAGTRYRATHRGTENFQRTFVQIMGQPIHGSNTVDTGIEEIDEDLCQGVRTVPNTEEIVEEFQEALDKACKSSHRLNRTTMTTKKEPHHKSVPWWTQRLTILRKKVNAQSVKYQRTKGDTVLREQRKIRYLTTKAEYATIIRKGRLPSWKEYCTMTSATNPWNEMHKIAAGRRKQTAPTTTLRQKDGELTTNLHESLQYLIQKLTPEDNQDTDNATHKVIGAATQDRQIKIHTGLFLCTFVLALFV